MPRRIVFHAGFHKTGTSTVQRFLRENRTALRPHVALRLRWHMKDLLAATRAYSMDRAPLTLLKVQSRFGNLMNDLPEMPKRTLVLSSEELLGHLPGRGTLGDYAAAPELLYAFWEIAAARYPTSEMAIYLSTRAPEAWHLSAYWEHVKSSDMTLDYDAFVATYPRAPHLDQMAAEIAARVPVPVRTAALEDTSDLRLGPVEPLLELCDLPADLRQSLVAVPATNVRPDPAALEKMLEVNRTTKGADRRKALKTAILDHAGQR